MALLVVKVLAFRRPDGQALLDMIVITFVRG
jgi:hypothetical protein